MKIIDGILALLAGRIIGFLIGDFLLESGINLGVYGIILWWIFLPLFSLCCLWLASLIGKKWITIFQMAKFVLVGAVATVIDLKFFEFLVWFFKFFILINSLVFKGTSFLLATSLKYWGNKYWTFQKNEQKNIGKEIVKLFLMDIFSLLINVGAFYYFTRITGPQFALSAELWTKISVILAALASAVSNFLGYKFLVFKK